jgi:biopolymer transport protein ExbD
MRIPSHHHTSAGQRDSTMTPLIDVVFLLLIFFVCTASFQIVEQNLPSSLRLASGAGTEEIEVDPRLQDLEDVVIKIFWSDDAPRWEINGERRTSLAEVRQVLVAIASIDTSVPVILDVDNAVPLGHVIDVYDLSRSVGFQSIQFAADIDA